MPNQISKAWRLLKTWSINEIPNRAPPLPEKVVWAMAGRAFFHGHNSFGISLIIGFYTMLRSGELLDLKSSHILCPQHEKQALISLGLTKGGKRMGAAESVVLGIQHAVNLVKRWKQVAKPSTCLAPSPVKWRSLFSECLSALGLASFQFRPYSLRRGGATFWFSKHQSLDRILVQGRWAAQRTARIYLNEGLAVLASMQIDFKAPQMRSFLQIFDHTLSTLNFSTLEPSPPRAESSGGVGRKSLKTKRGRKRVQKVRLCAKRFRFNHCFFFEQSD